jgi:hypothetical protein
LNSFTLRTGRTGLTRAVVTARTTEVSLSVGSDGSGNLDTSKVLEVKRLEEFLYKKSINVISKRNLQTLKLVLSPSTPF